MGCAKIQNRKNLLYFEQTASQITLFNLLAPTTSLSQILSIFKLNYNCVSLFDTIHANV